MSEQKYELKKEDVRNTGACYKGIFFEVRFNDKWYPVLLTSQEVWVSKTVEDDLPQDFKDFLVNRTNKLFS